MRAFNHIETRHQSLFFLWGPWPACAMKPFPASMRRRFGHGSLSRLFVQHGGGKTLRGRQRCAFRNAAGRAIAIRIPIKTVQLLGNERGQPLSVVGHVCSVRASRLPGKRALVGGGCNGVHEHQVFFACFVWYFEPMAFGIIQDRVKVGSDKSAKVVQKGSELVLGLEPLCIHVSNWFACSCCQRKLTSFLFVMANSPEQITSVGVGLYKFLGRLCKAEIGVFPVLFQLGLQIQRKEFVHEAVPGRLLIFHDVGVRKETLRLLVEIEVGYVLGNHAVFGNHNLEEIVMSSSHGRASRSVETSTHAGQVRHLDCLSVAGVVNVKVVGTEESGDLGEEFQDGHKGMSQG